jgi:hypothetical protein
MAPTTIQNSIEDFELRKNTQMRSQVQANDYLAGHERVPGEDALMQQLKPVDGGATAWTVLIAAFVFKAVLWGKHQVLHSRPFPHYLPCSPPLRRLSYLLRCLSGILFGFARIQSKF